MLRSFGLRLLSLVVLAGLMIAAYPAAAVPLRDAPHFGPIIFSLGFDEEAVTPVDEGYWFAADTVRLHATFEFEGVSPGTPGVGRWYLDGEPFSERSGVFRSTDGVMEDHIGTTDGLPLPEGTYGFEAEVDGEIMLYDECVVGESTYTDPPDYSDGSLPTFGDVYVTDTFDDELELPVGSAEQFDYGVTVLYFYCDFTDVPLGANGITTSYHDEEFLFQTDTVFDFSDGSWWETVENPDGSPLVAGTYSVIFEVDGRPSAMGECVVGGAAPAPATAVPSPATPVRRPVQRVTPKPAPGGPAISPITFGLDVTDDGEVVGFADVFPAGTTTVWAYFTYTGMQDGISWGRRWEENGALFGETLDQVWEYGDEGWLALQITDDPAALVGDYVLTLFVDGAVVRDGRFAVEPAGAVEAPTFAPAPAVTATPTISAWQGSVEEVDQPEPAPGRLPTFAPMQFTTELDATGRPTGSAKAFEPGIDKFYVYADWQGAQPDTTVLVIGTYYNPVTTDESLIFLNEGTLLAETGTWWETIYDIQRESSLLLPGLYRITVSAGAVDLMEGQIMISPDVESATQFYSSQVLPLPEPGEMPVASAEPVEPVQTPDTRVSVDLPAVSVSPMVFSDVYDWDELELGELATDFPLGTEEVYARIEYEGLPLKGMRWSEATVSSPELGNDIFVCDSSSEPYNESGTWTEIIAMHSGGTLPAGDYRVEFSTLDGGGFTLVQEGTFTVGGGG